jgi:hypothetical protein
MAATTHNKHTGFHITAIEAFLAFLVGLVAVGAIWLFTGLLIGLFFL